ncbi:MAG: MBL fold metallo-hydrolase [Caldisphaeraceae archaeon]|nr:MBL fold metallo-hydrolase [Caldisphaeraceae archaeon]MEB3691662.1 MBL fold metallo-hydrolase [Caldisphaeraceae archaeon]MEB3798050.1 MBL fold metallo-hydrolase [Caldisphaeraceae archaeon]
METLKDIYVIDTSPYELKGIVSSFLIVDEKVAIIDPGPAKEYERLRLALERYGVKPDIVIATHVHLDHAGATGNLLRDYPSSVAYVHPRGVKHIVDPSKLWEAANAFSKLLSDAYGKPIGSEEKRVIAAEDMLSLSLGKHEIKFIHTPGHASHHMSIILYPEKVLFSGDSAGGIFDIQGKEVYAITSPKPFKPKLYLESIRKMKRTEPTFIAPTHFGIHKNGRRYLDIAEERTVLWLNKISEFVKEGKDDVKLIYNELLKFDEDLRAINETGISFLINGFISDTIGGMIDAIKNGEW